MKYEVRLHSKLKKKKKKKKQKKKKQKKKPPKKHQNLANVSALKISK